MLKDFFLNEVKNGIKKAAACGKLGQMSADAEFSLIVEKPKNPDFGDFAVNVSSLARSAKIAPPMIAQAIVENLTKENYSVTVVGGFINFKIENSLLAEAVAEILEKKENYGKPENVPVEKILLEYVSANPTGPFHIGHGRWAAMGSALANLLKFYGHEVYQEFYINDAGSQIQKLGNSLKIRIKQQLGENIDFPTDEIERKNYYPGEYLIPVAKKYLSEHEPTDDVQVLSDYAKKEMEACQKALLKEFRVHFDNFYSELDLHKSGKVEESYKELMPGGIAHDDTFAIHGSLPPNEEIYRSMCSFRYLRTSSAVERPQTVSANAFAVSQLVDRIICLMEATEAAPMDSCRMPRPMRTAAASGSPPISPHTPTGLPWAAKERTTYPIRRNREGW